MTNLLSAVLVGDELGFIKRLDLHAKAKQTKDKKILLTLNREFIGEPSPDKSVLSITPLAVPDYFRQSNDQLEDIDNDNDNQITSSHNYSDDFVDEPYEESNFIYLIASRPNHIYLYNSYNQRFATIANPVEGNLIGSLPLSGNRIISCYDNGTINVQNIETYLIAISSRSSKKACKILGIGTETTEADHSDDDGDEGGPSASKKIKKSHTKSKGIKKDSTITTIFSPNWQPSNVCLTCFKVQDNRVAIGGKNFDMRVFDLNTKQCIFTAKSQKRDWLGIRHKVWTSDLDWIGPFAGKQSLINTSTLVSSPSMIATASRTDPVVRIYDLKSSSRKSIWQLNFKDQTFNNDSNPPSFTKICATQSPVNNCTPTQKIILGTTMGRMMAVDLRFNSHTCRHLGVFKCFGGGAIRDIKYVPLETNIGKVVSCSLDRFIKIHSFSMGSDRTRSLDHRYYMKTKPTCIQPIVSNVLFPDQDSDDEDDDEGDENDEDDNSHSIS
ncbi:uncharacterized protein LOC128392837 isoform X2 [Panonychus citri]|uniref:uncharacterized protein LOC128392837 isoform X2 n=1 Tax=Panonychus citri TaxID=50023 RepID=UPI002306E0EE|nr:uncharacterized protein LOC128392837 isoform X2 [Panonychus citri]